MVLLKSGRTRQHLQTDHPAFDENHLFGDIRPEGWLAMIPSILLH